MKSDLNPYKFLADFGPIFDLRPGQPSLQLQPLTESLWICCISATIISTFIGT